MGLYDDALNFLQSEIDKAGGEKPLADRLGENATLIHRYAKGDRVPKWDKLANILESLGCSLLLPNEKKDTARDVCFVNIESVNTSGANEIAEDDYIAVPLAEEVVAAGPGILPQDAVRGWVMVWKNHDSVRFTRNLVAVEIGEREVSMLPTFTPGDILLIDRDNRNPEIAGKTWLICEPDGGCAVKRVSTRRIDGDIELIFYSDNTQDFPPTSYHLKRDFDGDITRAIAGRVIWAWSDVRNK